MIVPDSNLLIYAYDKSSPNHQKAKAWWVECLSGDERVRLPFVVISGFVRISTNARLFAAPFSPKEAIDTVREWIRQPVVSVVEDACVNRFLSVVEEIEARGNLVSDAQIAAVALEENAILHTADTDFYRFPGLRIFNPLTARS